MEHATESEVAEAAKHLRSLRAGMNQILFGQEELIDQVVTGVLARGHILLEGLPGLGKTELCKGLSKLLRLDHKRIQFTPDLLPGDITGNPVLQEIEGRRVFVFQPGPLFANIVLADEINRASPKTQSALLEAMQERRVTLDGEVHALSERFTVVATQNPIESQGVYPLPEAQLDRFLFKLLVGYPSIEEEARIVARYGEGKGAPKPADLGVVSVTTAAELGRAQSAIASITLAESIVDYIVRLVRATRESRDLVVGASPRAAVLLAGAARARAALDGRDYVIPDDVKALATAVLRHRLMLSPAAEIEGKQVEAIVAALVEGTEAPR